MPAIVKKTREVFFAPTRGRCYFTKAAAVRAEAAAIIAKRYPSDLPEHEDGYMTYPGFNWREIPRSDVMFRRLCQIISKNT